MSNNRILIIGAGLAGLFLALKLAPRKVLVLSQSPLGMGASSGWAQGGIAAALSKADSPLLHAEDTINAGAGLVDEIAAKIIATEGPNRIADLLEYGVPFDKDENGNLELSLEAAHRIARVARVSGDLAGREIMRTLIERAKAAEHIEILENHWALSLLQNSNGQIGGALCANANGLVQIDAAHTILATGGIGGLYQITTNPIEARGQGLGMAARAGALIGDPEFVQFHPTAINIGKDPAPLASEALRGEGAILRNNDGVAFMEKYHELKDLAPRDIVARAVFAQNQSGRGANLDATKAIGKDFPEHFPTVFASCMDAGIDPRTQLIPIAPAEHYHMGGIISDLWGNTNLEGLSAIGECASTGVHGANRLASNSLLEAVVFAGRLAQYLGESEISTKNNCYANAIAPLEKQKLQKLRSSMQENVGVIRNKIGLEKNLELIDELAENAPLCNELIVAKLITQGALKRQESRGGHFRDDFTQTNSTQKRTFILL
jgi:L-aspartate oxidase